MADTQALAAIAEVAGYLGVDLLNPLATDWMIVDANSGQGIIFPDTVPRFEYRGESRVSDYPVEQGAFASYNKVSQPFDIRMMMVCSGLNYGGAGANATLSNVAGIVTGQSYKKGTFLETLDYMLATTDLFTIVTPDKIYPSVNMVHYDYKRETKNGATMLIVEAWFQEIRVTASAAYSSSVASPSAADPVSVGTVHTGDLVTVEGGPIDPQPVSP